MLFCLQKAKNKTTWTVVLPKSNMFSNCNCKSLLILKAQTTKEAICKQVIAILSRVKIKMLFHLINEALRKHIKRPRWPIQIDQINVTQGGLDPRICLYRLTPNLVLPIILSQKLWKQQAGQGNKHFVDFHQMIKFHLTYQPK